MQRRLIIALPKACTLLYASAVTRAVDRHRLTIDPPGNQYNHGRAGKLTFNLRLRTSQSFKVKNGLEVFDQRRPKSILLKYLLKLAKLNEHGSGCKIFGL